METKIEQKLVLVSTGQEKEISFILQYYIIITVYYIITLYYIILLQYYYIKRTMSYCSLARKMHFFLKLPENFRRIIKIVPKGSLYHLEYIKLEFP